MENIQKINFIPLLIPGGIGDLIEAAPVVEALKNFVAGEFPFRIYTNHPSLVPLFLPWVKWQSDIRHLDMFYDQTGEALELPYWIDISDVIHWRLRPGVEIPGTLLPLYEHWLKQLPAWGPLIGGHPKTTNQIAKQAVLSGLDRRTLPFHLIGLKPLKLPAIDIAPYPVTRPYITIHDGCDANTEGLGDRSTKQWSLNAWIELTRRLKAWYPTMPVIQLGGANSRAILWADTSYLNRSSFKQSLSILQKSLLHIDGDSGLVHARALFGKPSVVLFGPTTLEYYGYKENLNISPNECGNCVWVKEDWMQRCVIGKPNPICMDSITPDFVIERIKNAGLL